MQDAVARKIAELHARSAQMASTRTMMQTRPVSRPFAQVRDSAPVSAAASAGWDIDDEIEAMFDNLPV